LKIHPKVGFEHVVNKNVTFGYLIHAHHNERYDARRNPAFKCQVVQEKLRLINQELMDSPFLVACREKVQERRLF
jgi:hypothetical protein